MHLLFYREIVRNFIIIKISSKCIALLSPARIIEIYYIFLPAVLSNCSELQTIRRSGNIDSKKVVLLFFICRPALSYGLITLGHIQRSGLSNLLLVSAFSFQFWPEYLAETPKVYQTIRSLNFTSKSLRCRNNIKHELVLFP